MAFNYNDFSDYRYNSFTDEYSPKVIGFEESDAEEHVIPSTPPYIIQTYEGIQETTPWTTKVVIKETGETLTEVEKTVKPGKNKYRVNYDQLMNGQIEFNSFYKGKTAQLHYYGLGTKWQKSTLMIKLFGNGVTKVIASSDSSTGSQEMADQIILTTEDAGANINAVIDELDAIGGGEIKILEGTYNIQTTLVGKENIILNGSGFNTILNNYASYMINVTGLTNIMIKNMKFKFNAGVYAFVYSSDGGTFPGRKYNNLYVEAYNGLGDTPVYAFMDGIANNCIVIGNSVGAGSKLIAFYHCDYSTQCIVNYCKIGFLSSDYISNCNVENQKKSGESAYDNCDYSSNCQANNSLGIGFDTCNYLSNSYSLNGSNYGIYNCDNISSIYSRNNTYGFVSCDNINSSQAHGNSNDGFFNCNNVATSFAYQNTGDGFQDCENVTSCEANGNVNGFDGCKAMGFNYSHGNSGNNYHSSSSDRAGFQLCGDNADGGFNG